MNLRMKLCHLLALCLVVLPLEIVQGYGERKEGENTGQQDRAVPGSPEELAGERARTSCEYRVVNVSRAPSEEEGWATYGFDVAIINESQELLRTDSLRPGVLAIADGTPCGRVEYETLPRSVLLPGCVARCRVLCSVPSRASGITFFLVTPDGRRLSISPEGPFAPDPELQPQGAGELVMGQPLVLEKEWQVDVLGLGATGNGDEFRFWVRLKNLKMKDAQPNSDLCFVIADDRGCVPADVYRTENVPPLFQVERPLTPTIRKAKTYVVLIGLVDPNQRNVPNKDKSERLSSWKTYRFEPGPAIAFKAPTVTVEDIRARWDTGQYLRSLGFNIKNAGDLPVYVEIASATHNGRVFADKVERWISPGEKQRFGLQTGLLPRSWITTVDIEVSYLDGVTSCLWDPHKEGLTTVPQEPPGGVENLEKPRHYIEDIAKVIDSSDNRSLNDILQKLEQNAGAQFIVLTVETTGGIPIEQFSLQLAKKWQLGQKGKDNGLLFVVAVKDRCYRFECGRGLEHITPLCDQVGKEVLTPLFREGRYGQGIYEASVRIASEIADQH